MSCRGHYLIVGPSHNLLHAVLAVCSDQKRFQRSMHTIHAQISSYILQLIHSMMISGSTKKNMAKEIKGNESFRSLEMEACRKLSISLAFENRKTWTGRSWYSKIEEKNTLLWSSFLLLPTFKYPNGTQAKSTHRFLYNSARQRSILEIWTPKPLHLLP